MRTLTITCAFCAFLLLSTLLSGETTQAGSAIIANGDKARWDFSPTGDNSSGEMLVDASFYDITPIMVSPGETLTVNAAVVDRDRKRQRGNPPGPWIYGEGGGPYRTTITITGSAKWDNVSNPPPIDGYRWYNRHILIDPAWDGISPIEITLLFEDRGKNATEAPDGGLADASKTIVWRFSKKTQCPTSLFQTAGTYGQDVTLPTTYRYRADPDIGQAGRPDYKGYTINESFSNYVFNFTTSDLLPAKQDQLNDLGWTIEQLGAQLFQCGVSSYCMYSTFILDNFDEFTDSFSCPTSRWTGYFLPASFPNISYSHRQTYSCCAGQALGNSVYDMTDKPSADGSSVKMKRTAVP